MDYYAVLDLDVNADAMTITRAYRKMAVKYHPDKNRDNLEEAEVRFKLVQEAYEVLSNSERRKKYDKTYRRVRNGDPSAYDIVPDEMGVSIHDMDVHRLADLNEAFVQDATAFIDDRL